MNTPVSYHMCQYYHDFNAYENTLFIHFLLFIADWHRHQSVCY